jgi:type 1 glutamine amidotransferase
VAGLALALAPVESRILLFTKTSGFRHPSIVEGVAMVGALAAEEGLALTHTEDAASFTAENLARIDAVIWLSTTGDVLDASQQAALEAWVESGGGWVGIHAAADCEYEWPWYGELLGNGAWFDSHPAIQEAEIAVESYEHPGSGTFPPTAPLTEEWYNFQSNPRPAVEVVLTIDETTYDPGPGAMGADHPLAWWHEPVAGRAFYTALGHRPETYAHEPFREQVRGAMLWAAGLLTCPHDDDLMVENVTVTGEVTFSACDTIGVGPNVSVSGAGTHALFRAANRVAFGNGFDVGPAARLTVETGRSLFESPGP